MLIQDLRYILRQLINRPGFTVVMVATLAVGIGANTAIFSIVNAVLLRPLPYPHSEQLATWFEGSGNDARLPSLVTFRDWDEQSTRLDLAFARGRGVLTPTSDGPTRVLAAFVTPKFFTVLGVPALLGRVPSADGQRGSDGGAVISYAFWQRRFGGDPAIIGRPLRLDNAVYSVEGVMPEAFAFPNWADAWIPMSALPADDPALKARDTHVDADLVGRLRPGVSYDQAKAEMSVIGGRLAVAYPQENGQWKDVRYRSLEQRVVGDVQARLLLFTVAVGVLLLIVCVNLSSLQVARMGTRARELIIRSALGASAWRIRQAVILESLVLSIAGGGLGLVLVFVTLGALKSSSLVRVLPRANLITVDWRVIAFAFAVCAVTALGSALLPASQAGAPDLARQLREGASGGGTGRRIVHLRSLLVAAEVALAVTLLVGAGLLVRTLVEMDRVALGFRPERVYALDVFPPSPTYDDGDAAAGLFYRLQERLGTLPGVQRVALTNALPLYSPFIPTPVIVEGRPESSPEAAAAYRVVSAGFFTMMGIAVEQGRDFTAIDVSSRRSVAIVNQALAKRFLPGVDPLGQSVTVLKRAQARKDFGERMTVEIVGVAGDTRTYGPDQDPRPEIFLPFSLNPWGHAFLLLSIVGDSSSLLPTLRQAVLEVEPRIPFAGAIRSNGLGFFQVDDRATAWLAPQRFNAMLTLSFAVAAVLLTCIGIYGVTSQAMAFRVREAAIRMALGGTSSEVLRKELAMNMRTVLAGIAAGLVTAWFLTGLMKALVFGIGTRDPAVFVVAPLMVAVCALVACYRPIRRATTADPILALRYE